MINLKNIKKIKNTGLIQKMKKIRNIKNIKSVIKNANKKTLIIAASAAAAVLIAIVITVICINASNKAEGTAYVTPVSDLNTAEKTISGNKFSGVVESQKTYEIKLDSGKTLKEVLVNDGDTVEEGDELFLYDVEAMELEYENGEIEIERMQNEIDSAKAQISELESEKEKVSSDNQVSYTTQIQSLQTDIEKIEYDIKVKKVAQEKLEASIQNAAVTAPAAGTVKIANNQNGMEENVSDVIMSVVASGDFRIKGRINEQNIGAVVEGDSVIIRSRVDDSVTWKGTVSEISTEPETNNNGIIYGDNDSETTSSNYAFYVEPESIDNLMLGQHVLIEPDSGQDSEIEKEGIWLYDDYIIDADSEEPYVWAADNFGRLEKRYIKIGQRDENNGDSEILSGLDKDDLIAYPSDDYKEGMETSSDLDDELDAELGGGDDDMFDDGMFDEGMVDDGMFDDGVIDDEDMPDDIGSEEDNADESSIDEEETP